MDAGVTGESRPAKSGPAATQRRAAPIRVVEIEPGSEAYEEARELRYDALYAGLDLPRDLVDDTDGRRYVHLAAIADDGLVGYARLHLEDGDSHAYQVSVRHDRRGSGIGRLLMEGVQRRALAEGREVIELDARDHAVVFYERLGYEVVGDEFLSARTGTPHRKMRKAL